MKNRYTQYLGSGRKIGHHVFSYIIKSLIKLRYLSSNLKYPVKGQMGEGNQFIHLLNELYMK